MNRKSATIPITVVRDPRESFRRCSLRPLREHLDLHHARGDFRFDASGFTLLEIGAPRLSVADAPRPLLLLDSSWRRLPRLRRRLTGTPVPRSLPSEVPTAYPRRSRTLPDPPAGFASSEALFLATAILGAPDPALLQGYPWRDRFLQSVECYLATCERR